MGFGSQRSPYAVALGDRIENLHPSLREYFATIPPGHVGRGEGVFSRAGATHAWLRPLVRLVERRGVAVGATGTDVPFTVTNRLVAGRLVAERTFAFPERTWTMRDVVRIASDGRLIDELGAPSIVHARFDVGFDGDALVLTSQRVGVRLGTRTGVRLPAWIAPRIVLRESHDAATGLQAVDVRVSVPLLGEIYGYTGTFAYRIEQEDA